MVICVQCVHQESLAKFIRSHGFQAECSYCKESGCCVDDSILSDFMLIKINAVLVEAQYLSDFEQTTIFECGSDTAIFELRDFFEDHNKYACKEYMEKFIKNIPDQIDENGDRILYALDDGTLDDMNDFEREWIDFINSVEHKKRFFNREAKIFLDNLFDVLQKKNIDSKPIFMLNHEIPIYRARIAYDIDLFKKIKENPAAELGPTPARFASSQRMSAEGISVFYGALDRDTCISEIRPLVGDAVVSGEFRVIRDLKLLDLNQLALLQSDFDVFHDDYRKHSHASAFFKELVFQMSRPARRSIANPYLPTQVIFEYLSVKYDEQVDGLIYSAVQQNQVGKCIALFPQSSCVSQDGYCAIICDMADVLGDDLDSRYPKRLKTIDDCRKAGVNYSSLYWVPESQKYHRVRGVRYEQREYNDDFHFTAGDRLIKLIGERF